MAGDWIKMRGDLLTHPKVFKVAAKLKSDQFFAVGALFAFWCWIDKHATDGRVDGATPQLIDLATHVKGLSDALVSVDWLHVDDDGITVPGYLEHNGNTAKERALKNQRQAKWRDGKSSTGASTRTSTDSSTQPSTRPSTEASTREEKRREEKREPENPTPAIAGVVPGVAGDLLGDPPEGPTPEHGNGSNGKLPPCPHEKLIALYHDLCPTLDRVKTWNETRQGYARSRWRETMARLGLHTETEALDWWRELFENVAESDFLTGRVQPADRNRKPFRADLEWLLRPENFAKTIEGKYWGNP